MKLRLLDFQGSEYFCEVPDDTQEVVIEVISGDMLMVSPVHFDTSDSRRIDFYDGTVILTKEEFHILDEIEKTYELFE